MSKQMSTVRAGRVGKNVKYATANPIGRYLIRSYFLALKSLLGRCEFGSVLEVGCGEGLLLRTTEDQFLGKDVTAVDIDPDAVALAKQNAPFADIRVADACSLPFADNQFDLVLCCEMLEHLQNPHKALSEIARVSRMYAILSVPNEPLWRILNLLRGAYVTALGNTPAHVNHWSSKRFATFVSSHFDIVTSERPVPWTMLICKPTDR